MSNGGIDAFSRKLARAASSRRRLLRSTASAGVAALFVRLGLQEAAAQCRRNGKKCRRGAHCCSGICKGRRHKKKCRPSPGQGICTVEDVGSGGTFTTRCDDGSRGCFCYRTTRGAAFCGSNSSTCDTCTTDADCPADGFGPGSRCISVPVCSTGRACVQPCPSPA